MKTDTKKLAIVLLLQLSAMVSSILCFGQTASDKIQCVPDSLTCLTPNQQVFVLDMADDISTYKRRIILKDVIIAEQEKTIAKHEENYAESKKENALQQEKTKNAVSDKKVVEDQLADSQKKTALQKVGLWCLGILSAVETLFIGFDQLILH